MFYIILGIIIAIIFFSTIEIKLLVKRNNSNDQIVIEIKAFYGIIKYKKTFPLISLDIKEEDIIINFNEENSINSTNSNKEKDGKIDLDSIINRMKNSINRYKRYKTVIRY